MKIKRRKSVPAKAKEPSAEEFDEFFTHLQDSANRDLFPQMRSCFVNIALIDDNPDVKLCLEVGASLLFDKPLVLLVKRGKYFIPPRLRQIAQRIVEFDDIRDPETQERIRRTLVDIIPKPATTQ